MVRVYLGYHSEVVGVRIADIIRDLNNVDLTGVVYNGETLLHDLDRLVEGRNYSPFRLITCLTRYMN